MTRTVRALVLSAMFVAMALVVGACQTPIGPDQTYTRSDAKALIVFGLKLDGAVAEFQFAGYDAGHGHMASIWTGQKKYDGMMLGYSRDLRFFADIWEPGDYMVSHYCLMGMPQTCVSFSPSLHFEVKPGTINYLGNFRLYGSGTGSGHMGYTDEAAKAFMATFPRVDADFTQVEMMRTPGPEGSK
jgi:hypothetical protein